MEVKFNKIQLPCLRPVVSQVQSREETLELRLPDGLPDIGRVLGCWGQVLLRGKEWHDTSAIANAGVMLWVLYAPEDGTEPRIVEGWIPMQIRWEFPEESREGMLTVQPWLSALDGRNVSARKLMLRAEVSMMGSGMKPGKAEVSTPTVLPEDIRLLKKTYPMELPTEQGEKLVTVDEAVAFSGEKIHKIASYQITPIITERKIMANRLLFKGKLQLQLNYLSEDGVFHSWDTEIPFSQYTELDRDYSPNTQVWLMPVMTASELSMEDGNLLLKAGIAVQYIVYDQTMLEVVEDAYSPRRKLELERDALYLPARLDSVTVTVPVQGSAEGDFAKILDTTSVLRQAYPSDNGLAVDGQTQLTYRNQENELRSDMHGFCGRAAFEGNPNVRTELWPMGGMKMDATSHGDGATLRGELPMMVNIYSGTPIPMASGMEMSEISEADPNRPSMILRRAGDDDLWELAKKTGSTVEEILKANHLSDEPAPGKLLLIPII